MVMIRSTVTKSLEKKCRKSNETYMLYRRRKPKVMKKKKKISYVSFLQIVTSKKKLKYRRLAYGNDTIYGNKIFGKKAQKI